MAVRQFVDISGVAGPAQVGPRQGLIEVVAWRFAVDQPAIEGYRSVPDFGMFAFTKHVDRTTPLLLSLCARADTVRYAKLVVSSDADAHEVHIDLREVLVTKVETETTVSGAPEVLEHVTLAFGKVWFGTVPIDAGDAPTWFSWDLGANTEANRVEASVRTRAFDAG